jgi:hypothetical protein
MLKCQERLREFVQVLKEIGSEMDGVEDEKQMQRMRSEKSCLERVKGSLERLGGLKLRFKEVCEEKEQLAESVRLGMLGTTNYSKTSLSNPSLEAFSRRANAELRQKLERMLNEISVRFVNMEVCELVELFGVEFFGEYGLGLECH